MQVGVGFALGAGGLIPAPDLAPPAAFTLTDLGGGDFTLANFPALPAIALTDLGGGNFELEFTP